MRLVELYGQIMAEFQLYNFLNQPEIDLKLFSFHFHIECLMHRIF